MEQDEATTQPGCDFSDAAREPAPPPTAAESLFVEGWQVAGRRRRLRHGLSRRALVLLAAFVLLLGGSVTGVCLLVRGNDRDSVGAAAGIPTPVKVAPTPVVHTAPVSMPPTTVPPTTPAATPTATGQAAAPLTQAPPHQAGVTPPSSAAAPTQAPDAFQLVNSADGRCLSDTGAGRPYVDTCNGGVGENWTSFGYGKVLLITQETRQCLSMSGSANLVIAACTPNGIPAEDWLTRSRNGNFVFVSVTTGLCLEDDGAGPLYARTCSSSTSQEWAFR